MVATPDTVKAQLASLPIGPVEVRPAPPSLGSKPPAPEASAPAAAPAPAPAPATKAPAKKKKAVSGARK
jgi:hypothetical protein